jgi:hypothetical protein
VLIVNLLTLFGSQGSFGQDQWGDVPPEQLEDMVLLDFIKGTPSEKRTLDVLAILNVDPLSSLRAVFYEGGEKDDRTDKTLGVTIIIDGPCSVELNPVSRSIRLYEGIARKDIPELLRKDFSQQEEDAAISMARRLGEKLGVNLNEARTEVYFENNTVWKITFRQVFKGYLCPLNAFVVSINGSSNTIRMFHVSPFVVNAQTEIKVSKESAVDKAREIAKASFSEFKGKDVKAHITVDKPDIYPIGAETDAKGRYVGQFGKLAWPVLIDDSLRILYIDCETGKLVREIE